MIVNALAGKPLPVYGDGSRCATGCTWRPLQRHPPRAAGRPPGETYNVGGWNEKPNIEIVHTVCALLDELRPRADGRATAADHLRHRPPRPRPPLRHRRAQDRARAGWRPAETFDTGIRKTVQWYLDHPTGWRRCSPAPTATGWPQYGARA
jgi:dTDP-glucose 4,6-dehydratase